MTIQNSTSIIVKDFNGVKVQTFLAPYEAVANATHIIETENKLVLIDTHFLTPLAQAFKGYALSLNKPIVRIFISHGHPDHYFGLASAFSEYPAYTLAGIDKVIAEWGPQMIKNQKPMFGDLIPNEVVVPKHTLMPNTEEVIDGLTYQYEMVEGAESEAQLLIKLPQIGVIIAQDLVYSGVHLWLGMGWFDKWISELDNVLKADGYNYILAGHGLPCGKDEVILEEKGRSDGGRKIEMRPYTFRLGTGKQIEVPSPYVKQADTGWSGPRHLICSHWKITGGASPALYDKVGYCAVLTPSYEVAYQTLDKFGVSICQTSVRDISNELANRCFKAGEENLIIRLRENLAGMRVVISLDGGRTRSRVYTGKLNAAGNSTYETDWIEPKLFVIDVLDEEGRPDRYKLPIYGSRFSESDVLDLLERYLKRLGIETAKEVQILADGAPWIWNQIKDLLIRLGVESDRIVETLDYYHASQYVHDLVKEMPKRITERQRKEYLKEFKNWLWEGQSDQIVKKCHEVYGCRGARGPGRARRRASRSIPWPSCSPTPACRGTSAPGRVAAYMVRHNRDLLALMNSLTTDLERDSVRQATRLRAIQTGAFVLALANFLLIVFGMLRHFREVEGDSHRWRELARHDPLTGLSNRKGFTEAALAILTRAQMENAGGAVMMLDLDGFKPINDRYGHAMGDQILVRLADKLAYTARATDVVARLGGDEFTVILGGIAGEADLIQVADKIRAALAEPVPLGDGRSVEIGASVGHMPVTTAMNTPARARIPEIMATYICSFTETG